MTIKQVCFPSQSNSSYSTEIVYNFKYYFILICALSRKMDYHALSVSDDAKESGGKLKREEGYVFGNKESATPAARLGLFLLTHFLELTIFLLVDAFCLDSSTYVEALTFSFSTGEINSKLLGTQKVLASTTRVTTVTMKTQVIKHWQRVRLMKEVKNKLERWTGV